ncbi:hypothetical protein GCM10009740_04780 [Terrabacter terrae]|uniref:DUF5667 domain-containing protein n=1 Tax=Terrabacter terrae TaxID=318434 RepID=A0ABN2TSB2_9MICO
MDLGTNADGELLQRALEGGEVSEPGILELVAVLHAVQAVDQAALAPRAEFVSDLRARLLADDPPTALPVVPVGPVAPGGQDGRDVPGGVDARATSDTRGAAPTPPVLRTTKTPVAEGDEVAPGGTHPTDADPPHRGATVSVLRVAARPLKLVAAAAAAVLVLGGALGAASRSAVPGDTLYSIKQLLDRAAVQLAGSRYDEGLTYLAQAQEHIGDARDLLDGGNPAPHDLDTAYDAATDATRRAQTILLEGYRTEGRTDALTELADFYARAIPQVDAMRPRVPARSLSAWQRLRETLGAGDVATMRALASCAACGDRAAQARAVLAGLAGAARANGPGSSTSAPGTTAGSKSGTRAGSKAGGTGAPGRAGPPAGPSAPSATAPGALPLPATSVPGGVPLPGGGAVNLPTVGITSTIAVGGGGVTVPGATVGLPGVGVTSSTIGVGGGGVTLPGATIPLPSVTLGLPSVTLPTGLAPTKLLP